MAESPDHAFNRSRGGLSTKTHQLVESHGLQLVSICTAGQDGDSLMFTPLQEHLRVGRRTRPDAVLGDRAYSSKANRALLRPQRIEAVISEPSDQRGPRLHRGSRGGRLTTSDTEIDTLAGCPQRHKVSRSGFSQITEI
ncbi:transposase [Bacillus subtilis]|nr:transposase [Bacillus subtilis]